MFEQRIDQLKAPELRRMARSRFLADMRYRFEVLARLSRHAGGSWPLYIHTGENERLLARAVYHARAGDGWSTDRDLRAFQCNFGLARRDMRLLHAQIVKEKAARQSACHGCMRCAPCQNMRQLARVTKQMEREMNYAWRDDRAFESAYRV